MDIKNIIKTALSNVFANKIRTFLTMLGIIVGISSVIIISSVSAGSQKKIEDEFSELGSGNVTIYTNSFRGMTDSELLNEDDYKFLKSLDYVKGVTPLKTYTTEIKLLDQTKRNGAEILGVSGDYQIYKNSDLLFGRYISDEDVKSFSNVAIITNSTALKVFGYATEEIIGQTFSLHTWKGAVKYEVIGMIDNTNIEEEMKNPLEYKENIIVPYTSIYSLNYEKTFNQIGVVLKDPGSGLDYSAMLTSDLNNFNGTSGNYRVSNMMDFLDNIKSINKTIAALITGVAAISLFVGGVGVMNIMLVTVTERTREIGIRKSIGAKQKDILLQFLLESLTLAAAGGLIGIILGIFGGMIVGHIMDTGSVVLPSTIIISVGISTLVGIIFGVYPAKKASKLNPIDALRYE